MRQRIFLILLLALPVNVWSQPNNHAVFSSNFSSQGDVQTLVRNWDDRSVVSCYNSGNKWYFSCTDYSPFYLFTGAFPPAAQYSDALTNCGIMDMEILDDKVFFCGIRKLFPTGGNGIVGWFDLNLFMSGTFLPTIVDVPCSFELDKMVVYTDAGRPKVVAVGLADVNPNPSFFDNSMIVEINDVTGNPSCNHTIIDWTQNSHEYIYDVIYTGRSVVFVGTINHTSAPQYHIRVMDNPSNLASSTNGDMIYAFQGDSVEVLGQPHSIFMDDDIITISYVHHDNVYDNYFTRLRIVDTHTNPPANVNSQTFAIDYKEEPIDLAYSKNEETLILLQSITNIYNYNPKFAFLKPYYTWGYNADLTHFNNSNVYNSLDIYNKKCFVSVGGEYSYLQYIPTPMNNPTCAELASLKVACINNNPTISIREPLGWTRHPLVFNPYTQNSYNSAWTYMCGH